MYYKRSHKRYEVKIKGKVHPLGKNKKEAQRREKELREQLQRGESVGESEPTVREIITDFLEWTERNRKPRTFAWYQEYLSGPRGFAAFVKNDLLVRNLKKAYVTKWLHTHWGHTSSNTQAGAITTVKRAFNWAVGEDLIDVNPVAGYRKPTRTSRSDEAYMTPDQWGQVLESITYPELRDYIVVMRETGCRPQEIRKVTAEWFDRENHCWVFPIEESKGGAKQAKKPRIVLLTDTAFEICKRRAEQYPEGPIFRNRNGNPWTPCALKSAFQRVSKRVGFKIFPYAIRHTFATDSLLNGVGMQETAELMGHADTQMLSRHYQHIAANREHLRKALDQATGQEKNEKGKNEPEKTEPEADAA